MRILIVEDDPLQVDSIQKQLRSGIAGVRFDEVLKSEHAFLSHLDLICANKPDIILMDVMLRWTELRPGPPMPDDVNDEGYYRAGLRCQAALAAREKSGHIPIILYTILDNGDLKEAVAKLPEYVVHVRKGPRATELIEQIHKLINSATSLKAD
jgi:CheY-like chemotaxis protein